MWFRDETTQHCWNLYSFRKFDILLTQTRGRASNFIYKSNIWDERYVSSAKMQVRIFWRTWQNSVTWQKKTKANRAFLLYQNVNARIWKGAPVRYRVHIWHHMYTRRIAWLRSQQVLLDVPSFSWFSRNVANPP